MRGVMNSPRNKFPNLWKFPKCHQSKVNRNPLGDRVTLAQFHLVKPTKH